MYYEKFLELNIDLEPIDLVRRNREPFYATPIGAHIIGWDQQIHFCFVDGYDEVVFSVNPEMAPQHVHPIARNFDDFLSCIVAANGTIALEQLWNWTEEEYNTYQEKHYTGVNADDTEVFPVIEKIKELGVKPMENPYQYVRNLQKDFDYSKLKYTDDFYWYTGLTPEDLPK